MNFIFKFLSGIALGSFQASIPMFSRKNYDDWAFRMKLIFDTYELLDIILNGYVEPVDEFILNANQRKSLMKIGRRVKKLCKLLGKLWMTQFLEKSSQLL